MSNIVHIVLLLVLYFVQISARRNGWNGSESRSISLQENRAHGIVIESARNGSSDSDTINFSFGAESVPQFLIRHYAQDAPRDSSIDAQWSLIKLVEYAESDNVDGFNPEKDARISSVKFDNMKWRDFEITPAVLEGVQIFQVCATSIRRSPLVTICALVVEANVSVSSERIVPKALSWSMQVSNFPFFRNGTRLALKTTFQSNSEVQEFAESDAQDPASSIEDSLSVSRETETVAAATWSKDIETEGPNCYPNAKVIRSRIFKSDPRHDRDFSNNSGLKSALPSQTVYYSFITDCQPKSFSWNSNFGFITKPY